MQTVKVIFTAKEGPKRPLGIYATFDLSTEQVERDMSLDEIKAICRDHSEKSGAGQLESVTIRLELS